MSPTHDLGAALLGQRLAVILFRPKFAENIGSVARACLNMGCERIILVAPRDADLARARPLATVHAEPLLDNAIVYPDLSNALAPFTRVYGTTARLGGRRTSLLSPAQAASRIVGEAREGHDVALVFGPEDRGLTNAEIELCTHLVSIPTAQSNVSLNLAQAVLLILYACLQEARARPSAFPRGPRAEFVNHEEQEALFGALKRLLTDIDFIPRENPDYWMLRLRRIWHRMGLHREEYAVLMGICRQMQWALGTKKKDEG